MNDYETAVELAKLRTEMHATNKNLERLVEVVTVGFEERIRKLESFRDTTMGIVRLVSFIGAPGVAAIIVFLATK